MKITIKNCIRCGEDHKDLEAKKLTNPMEIPNSNGYKISHWAMCPKLNEPIMVEVIEKV